MKFIFKILFAFSAFFLIFVPIKEKAQGVFAHQSTDRLAYIVYGLDDAAENTDVIMLISYLPTTSEINVVQIPRDTYFETERGAHKINALYHLERLAGYSEKESMSRATAYIKEALGINVDGFLGFGTKAFVKGIDAIGGVTVHMPIDYTFYDKSGTPLLVLRKGDNLLSGSEAECFVRYREGYALADLDRTDAQKVFINGLLSTFKGGVGLSKVVSAIGAISADTVTDISLSDAATLLFKSRSTLGELNVKYATLPGKAINSSVGISYYVISKKPSSLLMAEWFDVADSFDKDSAFFNIENQAHGEIYYSENINCRIYTDEDITNEVKLWKSQKPKD